MSNLRKAIEEASERDRIALLARFERKGETMSDCTDHEKIVTIVLRALDASPALMLFNKRNRLVEAVENVHQYICPLDLDRMLEWPRAFDIVHDVAGISRHLNWDDMKLGDHFVPRFAKPQEKQK